MDNNVRMNQVPLSGNNPIVLAPNGATAVAGTNLRIEVMLQDAQNDDYREVCRVVLARREASGALVFTNLGGFENATALESPAFTLTYGEEYCEVEFDFAKPVNSFEPYYLYVLLMSVSSEQYFVELACKTVKLA